VTLAQVWAKCRSKRRVQSYLRFVEASGCDGGLIISESTIAITIRTAAA